MSGLRDEAIQALANAPSGCLWTANPEDKQAMKPYKDAIGRPFGVVEGRVIDPPIVGAALRVAAREIARASMDTSTCSDPAVTGRREVLLERLESQLKRLREIGLSNEIAAGEADFALSSQAGLRIGCSQNPTDNQRSLDSLEHWIDLLEKWRT
jgi:hypothetical protein